MVRSVGITGICMALLFVGLIAPAAAESSFIVLPSTKIDQPLLHRAQKNATDLLTGWRDGNFQHLSDDFSLEMIAGLPPEDQRKAYDSLRVLFGHFESLSLAEALVSPRMPGSVLFRFKGTFSGTKDHPEIRVVITEDGKIAGFWVKHWVDELQ